MLDLPQLDERTRRLMLEEVDRDLQNGTLYVSPRLSNTGVVNYVTLLKEAIRVHDETWLANELGSRRRLRTAEPRRKPGGGYIFAKVPLTAARMIAEDEFNRFYIRALCRVAIEKGLRQVIVYRAREARHPRPESQALIGKALDAQELLDDLRGHAGRDTGSRIPPGPNSGLSVRLPAAEGSVLARG